MYRYIIAIFLIAALVSGQESKPITNLNCKVIGFVSYGNSYYLNTDSGFVKINNIEDDPFEKYYREIYKDSTIVNPNTIINPSDNNSAFTFINPLVDVSKWAEKYDTFGNNLYLYDFMQINEDGELIFKPGIIGLIQKELQKEEQ